MIFTTHHTNIYFFRAKNKSKFNSKKNKLYVCITLFIRGDMDTLELLEDIYVCYKGVFDMKICFCRIIEGPLHTMGDETQSIVYTTDIYVCDTQIYFS